MTLSFGMEVKPEFKPYHLPAVGAWLSHLSLVRSIKWGQQRCLPPRTAVRDATEHSAQSKHSNMKHLNNDYLRMLLKSQIIFSSLETSSSSTDI